MTSKRWFTFLTNRTVINKFRQKVGLETKTEAVIKSPWLTHLFPSNALFFYPLKTSENLKVFRGYRKDALETNV